MEVTTGTFLEPFKSVGITPPRGRQGHSVPTPRPLQGSKLVHVARRIDDREEFLPPPPSLNPPNISAFPPKMFPTQFSTRRDHSLGGSVSRLDRIWAHHQEMPYHIESFAELEEEGGAEGMIEYSSHNDSQWTHPFSYMTTPSSHNPSTNNVLDKFTGDSLLHFSFNPGGNFSSSNEPQLGGSFVRAFTKQGLHTSLNIPSIHPRQSSTGDASNLFPSAAKNPNKAIVTIDAQSSIILMTNEITCELFGFQRGELVGMKVQNLFTEPYRAKQHALVERNIDESGKEVLVSGKVMDAVTSYGVEFPVSVWMKKVSVSCESPRVIVVMEPVERTSACFSLDHKGQVISCDPWFASLFGYANTPAVMGQSISSLIPSLSLPHSLEELEQMPQKQAVTGRTKDNTAFPLTVQFTTISQNLSLGDLYSPSHSISTAASDVVSTCVCSKEREGVQPANEVCESGVVEPASRHSYTSDSDITRPPVSKEAPPLPNGDSTSSIKKVPPADITNDVIATSNGEIPTYSSSDYINAKVIVYSALSGMVSFLPDGTIHGCNHHFSLMLFGYSQEELLRKDITFLMPDFYNHIGYVDYHGMPLPPMDEECNELCFQSVPERSLSPDSSLDYMKGRGARGHIPPSPVRRRGHDAQRSPAKNSPLRISGTPVMPTVMEEEERGTKEKCVEPVDSSTKDATNYVSMETTYSADKTESIPDTQSETETSEGGKHGEVGGLENHDLGPISSTPASKLCDLHTHVKKSESFHECLGSTGSDFDRFSVSSMASLPEGLFEGFIRHKDGSLIAVIFQLKCVPLADHQSVFCMWMCRDLDQDRARNADPTSATNRQDPYWMDQAVSPEVTEEVDGIRVPHMDKEEALAVGGVYMTCYDTLRSVGKGAFGFVKLAQRKSDKLMVVVKFLRKSGVLKDCWVNDKEMGLVAQEISLLARLSHPNIVMLLEAYENEYYFQMVMEKHGDGLDLFEFIEKSPKLTEPLASYMFRQVVAGLAYLHGKNILHRDVKDENLIMDRNFHMKLIDFGSAAYMEPGKLFHTFCGTLEYCSPEVLLGNSYPGPELEMWALGVTLYTLVFGENPFFDVEETISGHLQPPYLTSPGLMKVLFWLLHPHPKSRATLKDLQQDKWVNQTVDMSKYNFETVLGYVTEAQKPQGKGEKLEDLFDRHLHLHSGSSYGSDHED